MYKVLVTGGTRGIGAAIVTYLRGNGLEVIACGRDETADVRCDVTDRAQVRALREQVGPVHVLVNNVGGVRTAPFTRMTEEDWDWHFQINVKSAYYCTKAFLPDMLDQQWGRIIHIASTAAKIGGPYITAYAAAKHAIVGFTRALAQEVAASGITVNAVCPSYVDTPMTRRSAEEISAKTGRPLVEILDSFRAYNPQKRFVTTEEIAQTVKFLIDNGAVNGQAISLCGGETQ